MSETPQEQRFDPMVYVFPRITKCIFHKYGASGSIQKHDALCVLPLNIVNEKTYIFIWFWYIILFLLLIGLVVYRYVEISFPVFFINPSFKSNCNIFFYYYFSVLIMSMTNVRGAILNARNKMVPRDVAYKISQKLDIGDWWLIYMLGRNLDPIIYKDVLTQLLERLELRTNERDDEKA